MKKIAVLTNDLQYELVNKNPERIKAVKDATPAFVGFLAGMRSRGATIVHLQLINREDDPNAERYDGHLPVAKGSDGAQILGEFLDPSDIVVEKNKDSGFYEIRSGLNAGEKVVTQANFLIDSESRLKSALAQMK